MESSKVAINTAISFIIHSLDDLKNSGYEKLAPLIDNIEKLHKRFRDTGTVEYIYGIIETITDYKMYKDTLGLIFSKLCETIHFIVCYIKEKSLYLYEIMILKLFEFYQHILKSNVKTYSKFEELNRIISYIRDDVIRDGNKNNMREKLNEMIYDDPILKILISLLCPPEGKFSSFIELIDGILITNKDSVNRIDQIFSHENCGANPILSTKGNGKNLSNIELLKLKKKEKQDKLDKCKEELSSNSLDDRCCPKNLTISLTSEFNVIEKADVKCSKSSESSESSENLKVPFQRVDSLSLDSEVKQLLEEPTVFTSNVKTVIDKDIEYENPNDRLNRIINKYSKKTKISMDKSPPQETSKDSMIKIMSERRNC